MMGKVMLSGIVPKMTKPISGILASDLAVGSTVKLMENGMAVEYRVVNQGKPSGSSLYDDSCDGLWLLRKECYNIKPWHSSWNNMFDSYKDSFIHSYLNADFYNIFDSETQQIIKEVKVPYIPSKTGSVLIGANGITAKCFLLSMHEIGFDTTSDQWYGVPSVGARLSYFLSGGYNSSNSAKSRRLAYKGTTLLNWWTRDINTDTDTPTGRGTAWYVTTDGVASNDYVTSQYGIRPALILPATALFDNETLILKGVA